MSIADQPYLLVEEYSRIKEELVQREDELAIINSVQLGLTSRLDVQAIYDLVGDKIQEIFAADVVMISTYDQITSTVEHRYAIECGQRVYDPGPHSPGGFRSQIIQTRQPLLVSSNVRARAECQDQPVLPGTAAPKTWLGVPMMVGEHVTGILSLQSIEKENAFSDSDVRLLQTLAASMSVALENARLWEQESLYRKSLEREFEIGRRIQAGFLPEVIPQPRGWEIAASLWPAREVAGDFYDVFRLPGGKIGLVIADVCDKGLGAALFMTLFRSLLRAASNVDFFARVKSSHQIPAEERLQNAIALTNNYIFENHGHTSMFATIFFGVLDVRAGTLAYINAGHLPPVLLGPAGVKAVLRLTGPAVGVISDPNYTVQHISIEQDDVLFAYTDGLIDCVNLAGESYDVQGCFPHFYSDCCLSEVLARIHDQAEHHGQGTRQVDDITLLAVRRHPKS